ncbi:hypothetical protein Ahy_A07g035946 [Arachis hypogaea]|uniref:Aminotransferase-like plant mobile domain-containing protein n=1 Tax=Arachis hypogaea TaxID=3818 RepID=A0A445CEU8_ARAHY|nr:hypothetical protein Ahy_A07g035946 [Arachis hypogaea]
MRWIRGLKDHTVLTDEIQIQRYVKCHIILLFGTILFGDKSGAAVHWKFLPLLRNFAGIIQYSWGSTCLANLNRSLCRATHVDCKEIDGPLTLLLTWAWIRLPFLAPIPSNPRVFPIANRWHNWERENYAYRYHTLAHYKRLLDDLQEGHAYGIDLVEPDVIPVDIREHSGVPNQERDLGASHGEVLTGTKNQDWSDTHSFWVMQWTNRYSHILAEDLISDLVFQEDPEGPPVHNQKDHQQELPAPPPQPPPPPPPIQQEYWSGTQSDVGEQASFSHLFGFMAPGPGYSHSANVHDIPTDQLAHPSGITLARMSLDSIPQVHTSSENSGARMSVDSSRSADATRGILHTCVNRRISMTLIQETNKSVDNEADDYLVDHPDSNEDEDEDEDENNDEDEDEDHDDDPEPSTG